MLCFISPYRSVRYYIKEQAGRTPKYQRELFNLHHFFLRTSIESTFEILKNTFKILSAKPHHPFVSQVDIMLTYTVLHNYIVATNLMHDKFLNKEVNIVDEQGETMDDDDESVVTFSNSMTAKEQTAVRNE